jgi:hypothetical protein
MRTAKEKAHPALDRGRRKKVIVYVQSQSIKTVRIFTSTRPPARSCRRRSALNRK